MAESDSSALTQSGDEGIPPTPRDSVMTGTDAGTEDGEEDEAEQDASPCKFCQYLPSLLLNIGLSTVIVEACSRPSERGEEEGNSINSRTSN